MTQEQKILGGIGVVTITLVVGAVVFFSGPSSNTSSNSSAKPVDAKILVKKNSHVAGNPKANVTVVEFGDYQCPACGAAYPITKQVLGHYGSKIAFVFRNFPLQQHQNAQIAAEAAEAAGKQGKFWEMHDILYDKQTEWGESTNPMDYFLQYAKKIDLDVKTFKDDVSKTVFAEQINSDRNDGNTIGVNSTPTFYVNGEIIPGGVPSYTAFTQAIDSHLKK